MQRAPLIELKQTIEHYQRIYHLNTYDIIDAILDKNTGDHHEHLIPITIFTPHTSSLEAIVKYLKEHHRMTFSAIAKLLNRHPNTITTTYKNAQRKHPHPYHTTHAPHFIPLTIIAKRKLSVLESITWHLKEHERLSLKDISNYLGKNYNTIWTSYHNAKKKMETPP